MTSISARVNEIKLDIEDLNSLLENASRQKSKDVLVVEIRKLQTELINMQNQIFCNTDSSIPKAFVKSGPQCYEVKLNNYAWDQTDEFIKLYIRLDKVGTLSKDAIACEFLDRSVNLNVLGLDNKNYVFTINNLCEEININRSNFKTKTNMIIINLAKKSSKTWSCITSVEKRLKEAKSSSPPSATDTSDPNDSLMNLMKKMYLEGDDEMKKTIAKAWTEAREEKISGLPNCDE
ncbi:calcyclin-binding protein [Phymastichus coffea]|uniref:calcyclin-binding protein n=1 Tax=Phymastichus coffea TaxID=108790 RepID=UPI00273ABECE|nr:calcyclin-binding protein [Phymastichus coffea]